MGVKRKSEILELEKSRPKRMSPIILKFRKIYHKYPTENELQQFKATRSLRWNEK